MKILIITALLGVLGIGSFHLANAASAKAATEARQSCEATAHCTPQGTCVVTCHKPDGSTCSIELACDGEHCSIAGCDGPHDCPQGCLSGCR